LKREVREAGGNRGLTAWGTGTASGGATPKTLAGKQAIAVYFCLL
jgi:hypothetical protein